MNARNEYHYLPVDDPAAEWGFYLTSMGRVLDRVTKDMPHGVHPDMYMFDLTPAPRDEIFTRSPRESGRVLPEFAVIFITDTHAVFESDETGVIEFDAPTLLFLFPGVWHRYRSVKSNKDWLIERWIGFNGDIAYRLMNLQTITAKTACRPAAKPQQLAAAFDRLVDRISDNPSANPMLFSMHAMDLLADCIESAQDGTDGTDGKDGKDGSNAWVARMLNLIWTGSHRDLTVDQLCELVGVRRRSMERWFTMARGHSMLTEVNLCRCRRARHFLETTDLPIKNICWLAGFRNTEQMRVNFQRLVGMSPDQYRLRQRSAR
jgi:AraC-like DNA-binding protein